MSIRAGLTAGFVATVVLSLVMIGKSSIGLLPQVNPISDMVAVATSWTGFQWPVSFGWFMHFFIGSVVWGIAYSALEPHLPGPPIVKGLAFGVLAWLAMMIVFMPIVGHGFFGVALGPMAIVATFVLHLIYGGVLGVLYKNVSGQPARSTVYPA